MQDNFIVSQQIFGVADPIWEYNNLQIEIVSGK